MRGGRDLIYVFTLVLVLFGLGLAGVARFMPVGPSGESKPLVQSPRSQVVRASGWLDEAQRFVERPPSKNERLVYEFHEDIATDSCEKARSALRSLRDDPKKYSSFLDPSAPVEPAIPSVMAGEAVTAPLNPESLKLWIRLQIDRYKATCEREMGMAFEASLSFGAQIGRALKKLAR